MMEASQKNILIGVLSLVVIILLALFAYNYYNESNDSKDNMCGCPPRPDAQSEANALLKLGSIPKLGSRYGQSYRLNPAWYVDPSRYSPCFNTTPAVMSEAHDLQQAGALQPGTSFFSGMSSGPRYVLPNQDNTNGINRLSYKEHMGNDITDSLTENILKKASNVAQQHRDHKNSAQQSTLQQRKNMQNSFDETSEQSQMN